MIFWDGEIKELDKLYDSFRGHLPDIVKELEQLIKTEDPNVVMLYSRRCLEVIVTDLCETELKRPRKTEPLKGIIDKLNSEEKVPSHIITSMLSLNSMANYGAHPKDFDPEQVKPVLNNLAIIIRWYLKYKDFQIVSKTEPKEKKIEITESPLVTQKKPATEKKSNKTGLILIIGIIAVVIITFVFNNIRHATAEVDSVKYGEELDYLTLYDSLDNQLYMTIQIGDQIWMAENLRTTTLNDGTPIPLVKDEKKWEKLQTPAYCWYNNNKRTFGKTYGPLYNWFAVNTGKLCPAGWHVPTDDEWTTLTNFLGDSVSFEKEVAGIKMKEEGFSHWAFISDTIESTNETGFTALPGGMRTIYGLFWGMGEEGTWWSSTEDDYNKEKYSSTTDAKNREIYYNYDNVTYIQQYKQSGMSVRCIMDQGILNQ